MVYSGWTENTNGIQSCPERPTNNKYYLVLAPGLLSVYGLAAHIYLILQLSRDLGGLQLLRCDQEFQLSLAIYGRCLYIPIESWLCHSINSGTRKYSSQQTENKRSLGAYFKWNDGHFKWNDGHFNKACGFRHTYCGGSHTRTVFPLRAKKPATRPSIIQPYHWCDYTGRLTGPCHLRFTLCSFFVEFDHICYEIEQRGLG